MSKIFSIITVTWNNAEGLQRTLESIRQQTYAERQLIIIDGASTDGTADVLKANDDIISVSISEKDRGIYDAMNKGLRYATGDYVVFMNAGDCFASPDTLALVSRQEEDLILGSATYGGVLREAFPGMTLYDILSIGINHQSVYYRTEIIRSSGFDLEYKVIADLKSVVEPIAKRRASYACLPEVLSICEGGGMSKQRWREVLTERSLLIDDVVDPFYAKDYKRMARLNHGILSELIVLSQFSSIFPVLKWLARFASWYNRKFKHIPLEPTK